MAIVDVLTHMDNSQEYICKTRGLHCIWDTLQYRLEESVSHWRTRQVTQLFTYLLTHTLFSSCIRRYLVSRACDWVMPALSAVLLLSVSSSVCFSSMSKARQLQRCTWFTQYRTSDVSENVGSTFLVRGVQFRGKTLNIDSNGKNRN